jgi:hypothetical protein
MIMELLESVKKEDICPWGRGERDLSVPKILAWKSSSLQN